MSSDDLLTDQERQEFYTPAEVARMFGVTPKTVSNWCDRGRLEYITTPAGHRRILATAIKGGRSYDEKLRAFDHRMKALQGDSPVPSGEEIAEAVRASREGQARQAPVVAETAHVAVTKLGRLKTKDGRRP